MRARALVVLLAVVGTARLHAAPRPLGSASPDLIVVAEPAASDALSDPAHSGPITLAYRVVEIFAGEPGAASVIVRHDRLDADERARLAEGERVILLARSDPEAEGRWRAPAPLRATPSAVAAFRRWSAPEDVRAPAPLADLLDQVARTSAGEAGPRASAEPSAQAGSAPAALPASPAAPARNEPSAMPSAMPSATHAVTVTAAPRLEMPASARTTPPAEPAARPAGHDDTAPPPVAAAVPAAAPIGALPAGEEIVEPVRAVAAQSVAAAAPPPMPAASAPPPADARRVVIASSAVVPAAADAIAPRAHDDDARPMELRGPGLPPPPSADALGPALADRTDLRPPLRSRSRR